MEEDKFSSVSLLAIDSALIKTVDYEDFKDHFHVESQKSRRVPAYPKSVWFIICNEFCERFSYYGLRTVLVLYLTSILQYDADKATIIYHMTVFLAYFSPLFGAILSDSYLGKFKTILYLSIVYAIGNLVVTGASMASCFSLLNQRNLALLGLILISIGTGGIKPCVSSFGGDQFVLPAQEIYLQKFFSIFYFSINAGALISTSITPELRKDVQCFGRDSCYPLAFGLPAVLMVVSTIVFISGKRLYKIKKPESNVIVMASKCIYSALKNKIKLASDSSKKDNWLDYADSNIYSESEIADVRSALNVIYLFIPFPFFWALFDQQGSRWTLQATLMNGRFDFLKWTMKPDQMQVVNPLLVLFFIPLFETAVYPLLKKIGIRKPLQKITLGGVLAAIAFVCSAILQFNIIGGTTEISTGESRLIIFNGFNCNVKMNSTQLPILDVIKPLDMIDIKYELASNEKVIPVNFTFDKSCSSKNLPETFSGEVVVTEEKESLYFLSSTGDKIELKRINKDHNMSKRKNGNPIINVLYSENLSNKVVTLHNIESKSSHVDITLTSFTEVKELPYGKYEVFLEGQRLPTDVYLLPSSVNTLIIEQNSTNVSDNLVVLEEGNYIHILWQLPQIILMSAAEIMFSITGLEFSFTQAPVSMKSLLAAVNLLTVSLGNLIVVFVSEVRFFENQAHEYLLFAGLMICDMVVFAFMGLKYKYKTFSSESVADDAPREENKQC
ncbi:peptide transporter family 1-like isoform X2 [Adelges cooleyi]|uniref:peptide transporter family 1-like isoform X2 n=1 Tax=Adelges cooleyi TaxID=133065 RepID=UPI00217F2E91|nr:peptide transporter family 1-like isoform X2 [Adelges cooleyi]